MQKIIMLIFALVIINLPLPILAQSQDLTGAAQASSNIGKISWINPPADKATVISIEDMVSQFTLAVETQKKDALENILCLPNPLEQKKLINELCTLNEVIATALETESVTFTTLNTENITAKLKQKIKLYPDSLPLSIEITLKISYINNKWWIADINFDKSYSSALVTETKDFGYLKVTCSLSPEHRSLTTELIKVTKDVYDFYTKICGKTKCIKISITEKHLENASAMNIDGSGTIHMGRLVFRPNIKSNLVGILAHEIAHSWGGVKRWLCRRGNN